MKKKKTDSDKAFDDLLITGEMRFKDGERVDPLEELAEEDYESEVRWISYEEWLALTEFMNRWV